MLTSQNANNESEPDASLLSTLTDEVEGGQERAKDGVGVKRTECRRIRTRCLICSRLRLGSFLFPCRHACSRRRGVVEGARTIVTSHEAKRG